MKLFLVFFVITVPGILSDYHAINFESLLATPKLDPVADRPFLKDLIKMAYGGSAANGQSILEFIEILPLEPQRIVGYRLLFDEMLNNDDLHTVELMTLAWRVKKSLVANPGNSDLTAIHEKLPESVVNFPWNEQPLRIKNLKYQEYFYSTSDWLVKDAQNRRVFSWGSPLNPECIDDSCEWQLREKDGENFGFQLWNVKYNELMYAATNHMLHDYESRNVYTWREKEFKPPGGDLWMFEPVQGGNSFRLFNMYYREYFYLPGDNAKFDPIRRRTFTWRPSGCDGKECEFTVHTDIDIPI